MSDIRERLVERFDAFRRDWTAAGSGGAVLDQFSADELADATLEVLRGGPDGVPGTRYVLDVADVELATGALRREAGAKASLITDGALAPAGDAVARDRVKACRELSLKLAVLAHTAEVPPADPLTRLGRLLAARLDVADVRDELVERSAPVALAIDNALELLSEAADAVRALDDGGIACACPTALRAIGMHAQGCPGHGGQAI